MAYPFTKTGYNIYDLMSLMQKAIRRGKFNEAGFAAKHLKDEYRTMMWNRLLVISSEDCYGVITKEVIALHNADAKKRDDEAVSKAVALMCKSLKSRDACYFSCNFVLSHRNPREIEVNDMECERVKTLYQKGKVGHDEYGFQMVLFFTEDTEGYDQDVIDGVRLQKAIVHRDMDMAGYYINKFRKSNREYLWKLLFDIATIPLKDEVMALYEADKTVNKNRRENDEIFIAKACILEMYAYDQDERNLWSSEYVSLDLIDWKMHPVKNVNDCDIEAIPDYTYDCHTLKGKKMGKRDWDMTVTEQEALNPLAEDYFSEASWIYTYEDDYVNGVENDVTMIPIREFAKTHSANPVPFIPYEQMEK